MPSSGNAESYGSFIPRFIRNLHTVLHSGCQFTSSPAVQEGSLLSTLGNLLFEDIFFDDDHSDWCEVDTSL